MKGRWADTEMLAAVESSISCGVTENYKHLTGYYMPAYGMSV